MDSPAGFKGEMMVSLKSSIDV